MKKVVLKLNLHDNKDKQKAMKAASGLAGIDSVAIDMKEQKLTVIGDVDPVNVVNKLRKLGHAEILSVGPAKEPEKKKEEAKKDGANKEEPKKDGAKKEEPKKKDHNEHVAELVKAYQAYNPHMTQHYYVQSAEENPNACIIC